MKKQLLTAILIISMCLASLAGCGAVPINPATVPTDTVQTTSSVTPTAKPTDTMAPTPTVEITATPTAEPTATATPTETPEPTATATAEPTATDIPTETPTPTDVSWEITNTPVPTSTNTPKPTQTTAPQLSLTPSATPTAKATNTPKPTSTNTPTPTATKTPVPTATNTPTPTATNTPTPTSTNTPKPTATNTPKPTATNTPTPTATNTPRPTSTNTPKPTATNTPKPTSTNTPKPTATNTPKPTATNTPKPTATNTPKPTSTNTPKPTATNTPKPTATNTPKPTSTNTPKPTSTNTPKPTATNTPKPTATNTPKPTATNTPKPTATNTPTPTSTSTPTPTNTSTPTPTATDTPLPTATDTPLPTATDTPLPTPTNAVTKAYSDKWGYNYYVLQDAENGTDCAATYVKIYEGIADYLTSGNSEISLGNPNLCNSNNSSDVYEVIFDIYYAVYCDNPQFVWIESGSSAGCSRHGNDVNYTISPHFFSLTDYDFNALYSECLAAKEEVASEIRTRYGENPTKIQIVKVIHDYIILKKDYDKDYYNEADDTVFNQNMLGIFASSYQPVCMSYATAFKWLCNSFGIQCETVSSSNHAWNLVNYGENVDYSNPNADYHSDTWYEMDVTWDDPTNMGGTYIGYTYFNLTTEQMSAVRSHTKNNQYYQAYPTNCTGTEYSYRNCVTKALFY